AHSRGLRSRIRDGDGVSAGAAAAVRRQLPGAGVGGGAGQLDDHGVAGGAVAAGHDAFTGVHGLQFEDVAAGGGHQGELLVGLPVAGPLDDLGVVGRGASGDVHAQVGGAVGDGVGGAGAGDRREGPVLIRAAVAGPLDQLGAGA